MVQEASRRAVVLNALLHDRAGRRRSPATMSGFHAERSPQNKGLRYPADPPKVEEIVAVMHAAGDGPHGKRLRALLVVLWRAGLPIQAAGRSRSRPATGIAAGASRQGRPASRSRHGRMGLAATP